MNIPIYLCCLLLAQPASELHFRKVEYGQIEVVAPLSAAQRQIIPSSKLAAEQGETWLRLCILDSQSGKLGPTMLGSYKRDDTDLTFRPRFGVEPGLTYRATFGRAGGPVITKDYRPPLSNGGAPATVVKIYPSGDVQPANLLKFYIYFSQPMRGGQDIFNQLEILDADGNVIPDAWLADELWDETGQILIVYIHPGRIKWGVVLREVLGPVLLPQRDYSFVVRGAMVDANGCKLGKDVMRKFRTTAEDRRRVNLDEWKISAPKSGTFDPVAVQFRHAMDHKSLDRLLAIQSVGGVPVAGKGSLGKDEKSWSFTPERAWESQDYRLVVNGRLEDVAGNTPLRPFDMDLEAPVLPAHNLNIRFRPRP
jgi:hypothetical protein